MWVHVASTSSLTHYYGLHSKRGNNKATDEIGILPWFEGVAVHIDGWAAYRTSYAKDALMRCATPTT